MADVFPQVIIFDLDGTLTPTMEGFARIAADVIHRHQGWPPEKAYRAYLDTSGIPFFQQLEVLFPAHKENSRLANEFEERKLDYIQSVPVDPSVKDALHFLKSRGHRLVISSNNFEEIVKKVTLEQLPDLFDLVCGYREGFAKGKEHFQLIQSEFEAEPKNMLFVGDSLSDFAKAKTARIPFIGVLGTFSKEAFWELNPRLTLISSVAELPQHLKTNKTNLQLAEI